MTNIEDTINKSNYDDVVKKIFLKLNLAIDNVIGRANVRRTKSGRIYSATTYELTQLKSVINGLYLSSNKNYIVSLMLEKVKSEINRINHLSNSN